MGTAPGTRHCGPQSSPASMGDCQRWGRGKMGREEAIPARANRGGSRERDACFDLRRRQKHRRSGTGWTCAEVFANRGIRFCQGPLQSDRFLPVLGDGTRTSRRDTRMKHNLLKYAVTIVLPFLCTARLTRTARGHPLSCHLLSHLGACISKHRPTVRQRGRGRDRHTRPWVSPSSTHLLFQARRAR